MINKEASRNRFLECINRTMEHIGRAPIDFRGNPAIAKIIQSESEHCFRILAGPGSGKTEMLVWRILYDLAIKETPASRILVTTFTRRAAEEITVRLSERGQLLSQSAISLGLHITDLKVHDLRVGTIHSLCDALLAEHVDKYYQNDIRLLDELEADLHLRRWWFQKLGSKPVRSIFSEEVLANDLAKALIKPAQWSDAQDGLRAALAHHTETWMPRCGPSKVSNGLEQHHGLRGFTESLTKLQKGWTTYLIRSPLALDFTQIQAQFLKSQSMMLNAIDHVYVDEFQDTNPIQYAIHFGWLTSPGRDANKPPIRLTVVGDDDQSIYRFRGSDVGCFINLKDDCEKHGISFGEQRLENNYRSTTNIVQFSQAYRNIAIPAHCSLKKTIKSVKSAGPSVRLVTGQWADLCALVTRECSANGYGKGKSPVKDMAALMFSASEKVDRSGNEKPAGTLTRTMKLAGIAVSNPRNKTAANQGRALHTLTGLISWFVDPIKKERNAYICASIKNARSEQSPVALPAFLSSDDHIKIQAALFSAKSVPMKDGHDERSPDDDAFNETLDFLKDIRASLIGAWKDFDDRKSKRPRLTMAGLIARLITMPLFRDTGYSLELFLQAMFTQIGETAISASRSTGFSIDEPIEVRRNNDGKIEWDSRIWDFVGSLGLMIGGAGLNDPEVEALQQNAFPILTFHQSKGLEFDEVYLAATGRAVDPKPVILTKIFSGEEVDGLKVDGSGIISHADVDVDDWAQADAAREIYVAMTRAKERLTILHDPNHHDKFMGLDTTIAKLFKDLSAAEIDGLSIQEWQA